jgi:hypothetical protein
MITSGKGKYKVWLKHLDIGDDKVFILGGGQKSHLGGVIICEPGKETKIIKLNGHLDYIVLKPIAEEACKKYNTKAISIGGVHINNASKYEINKIISNCRSLVECI